MWRVCDICEGCVTYVKGVWRMWRVCDVCEGCVTYVKGVWHMWRVCDICEGCVTYVKGVWHMWRVCDICEGCVTYVKGVWHMWRVCDICEGCVTYMKGVWHMWRVCDICEGCDIAKCDFPGWWGNAEVSTWKKVICESLLENMENGNGLKMTWRFIRDIWYNQMKMIWTLPFLVLEHILTRKKQIKVMPWGQALETATPWKW